MEGNPGTMVGEADGEFSAGTVYTYTFLINSIVNLSDSNKNLKELRSLGLEIELKMLNYNLHSGYIDLASHGDLCF